MITSAVPITLETLTCFLLATILLHRYSDMVNNNIVTVVGVFISWFFSFMVIFLLPADLTSTAYRQCLLDGNNSIIPTTPTPPNSTLVHNSIVTIHSQSTAAPIPQNSLLVPSLNQSILRQTNGSTPDHNNSTNSCVTPWNYVPDVVLIKLWRFIYWTCQFLTWLVLPIMQSYSMAGDFNTKERLKSAISANLIYYATFGVIFTVLLIYVIFKNGFDFSNIKVIAISASNTWGLFLLVILLGYGLVDLPRYLINQSEYSQSLSRQYFRVSKLNADKCEAEEKLDDALEEIHHLLTIFGTNEQNPMKLYLDKIIDKCPPDWKRRSNAFRRQAAASNSIYETDRSKSLEYDQQSMIKLHRKVIKAVQYHKQITCRWNHLITEVIQWEDVARNQLENQGSSSSRSFKNTLPRERSILHNIYTPQVEWYWKCVMKVWLLRVTGVMLAIFSLAVVWSEIAFPLSIFSTRLSIFAYFVDSFQAAQQYFYLEIFSTLSIGYLAICAFYTVFHMKIYNIYYLASNKQTDEYSLLFSGMLICRLTAPLCLNYLCLVNFDSHIFRREKSLETSFTTIMGHLDLLPIVNRGLNIFLPLCISAICLVIYFDFGTRILHSLGFEQFIENDEATAELVQMGRELVVREKGKLLRNYESSNPRYHEMTSSIRSSTVPSVVVIQQQSNQTELDIADNENSSPTSHSSSSSGFSRSSLLPKAKTNQGQSGLPPSIPIDPGQLPGRAMGDNVIEIDMRSSQQEPSSKSSTGFFDDV